MSFSNMISYSFITLDEIAFKLMRVNCKYTLLDYITSKKRKKSTNSISFVYIDM